MGDVFRLALIALRRMWNHRGLGLVAAWIVATLAFIGVALTPERYEASARMLVNTGSILKPLMSGVTVIPNDEQRIAALGRVVTNRPNMERLVKEAGLDSEAHSRDKLESVVDNTVKGLKFAAVGRENNLYSLSFRHADPEKARKTIELLTAMFMDQSKGAKTTDTEAAKRFIDEQIQIYETKLREAETKVKEFRTENMGLVGASGERSSDFFTRMAETERVLNQARLELREAERSRDSLRREVQVAASAVVDGSQAASELDVRIDQQRRNLDSLLQKFTESHPDVSGARRTLADLEAQRSQIKGASRTAAPVGTRGPSSAEQLRVSLANAEANVAGLSARVGEFAARHDKLKASASLVPKLEAELAQLSRDYDVNKKNYEMLVARRESAAITGEMQDVAGLADFKLVDPPRVTRNPVWPNHALLFPLALLFAIGAGFAVAWLAGELRPSFYDGRDLREATGLPLLGVVSLNMTDQERSSRRRGAMRFAGSLGALVVVYVAGIVAVELVFKNIA